MNPDCTKVRNLTGAGPAGNEYRSWSPDGRELAFQSYRDGNWEICVMRADGTNQRRMTRNPGEDSYPDWSPDGKTIAFNSVRDSAESDIFLMKTDGSDQRAIRQRRGSDWEATWSRDGTTILFGSDHDATGRPLGQARGTSPPPYRLYVMNSNGTGERPLREDRRGTYLTPDWRPIPG
jgi:Tol biopolymer transport system component